MLSQTGEWYKTTAIQDNDERLAQRRRAAETLVASWEKAAAPQIIDVVCLGLEAALPVRGENSPALGSVLDAIAHEQPTFDRALGASAIDPRLCVLVGLSEFLHRRMAKPEALRKKESALIAAQALTCALRYRLVTAGGFLDEKVQSLLDVAEALLVKLDQGRRVRRVDPAAAMASVVLSGEAAWANLKKAVLDSLNLMTANAALDREELQALWWVFGGYSISQQRPFAQLPPATAALTAGVELSSLIAWPGTMGTGVLAARVAVLPEGVDGKTCDEFFDDVDDAIWRFCLAADQTSLVDDRSITFPLLSAAASGDHRLPTSILMRPSLSREEIAVQAFSERCLLAALVG